MEPEADMSMLRAFFLTLTLSALVAAAAAAQPPATPAPAPGAQGAPLPAPGSDVVVNNWQLVQAIMKRIAAAPPRPNSVNAALDVPAPDYPFEAFQNLRAKDLLRAATDGAAEARKNGFNKPPEEVERQARANAALALEYLPLLIRDRRDAGMVAGYIGTSQSDPVVRRYLVEQFAPDAPATSLLGDALNDMHDRFSQEFRPALEAVSSLATEEPDIQALAIRVLHDRYWNAYAAAYAADPLVAERSTAAGVPEPPSVQLGKTPPPVKPETLSALREQGAMIQRYAESLGPHIAAESIRDDRVKEETRRTLQHFADNVLLPDRNRVLHLLNPAAAAPLPATGGDMPIPLPDILSDAAGEAPPSAPVGGPAVELPPGL
jgi:hypothetical protein